MVDWEKRLDRIYPKLTQNSRCAICGRKAEHQHHIKPRANELLRYDTKNLLSLCGDCHHLIHDKGIKIENYISPARWLYLNKMMNIQFQDYLLEHNLTRDEFFAKQEKKLKEAINGKPRFLQRLSRFAIFNH